MIATSMTNTRDPRADTGVDELAWNSVRSAPEVGRPASAAEGMGLAVGIIGAAALGGLTILSLAHHHVQAVKAAPAPVIARQAPAPASRVPVTASAPLTPPRTATLAPARTDMGGQPPLLVLDNSAPPPSGVSRASIPGPAVAKSAKSDVFVSPDEQFAARAGDEAVPTSHVARLDQPGEVVAQGTLIPAVLETALDSDLPGYARALVSRDVRSFDGSKVLIPRGSRLIGQYKSALQAGQSRALIVWNRLLRPDGVSMQMGSPAIDDVGEAGLAGKVNSHFMQRFGSAILLSVVEGLASAVGGSGSNTVVLGSVGGGSGAAGVALQNQIKISPTVKVMQGTPIQVFTARDLDFSENAE
jgi:type IV secretion system protein VirB10